MLSQFTKVTPLFDQAACGVASLASDYATLRGKGWASRPAAAFGGHVPLAAGGEVEPFL
jgi:hypothetical protein